MDASLDAIGEGRQDNFMNDPYPKEWAKLARTTDIVKFAYPEAFAGMPERNRQFYFDRGSANHLAWQMVEEGTADGYDFDPEVTPYLAAHANFLRDSGFRALPGGIEMRLHSVELGVKGTLDRLGTIQNRVVLLDYKTTKALEKPVALQTSIYLLMIPGYKFSDVERRGVGFAKGGKYSMTNRFPDSDENDARYWIQKYRKEVLS